MAYFAVFDLDGTYTSDTDAKYDQANSACGKLVSKMVPGVAAGDAVGKWTEIDSAEFRLREPKMKVRRDRYPIDWVRTYLTLAGNPGRADELGRELREYHRSDGAFLPFSLSAEEYRARARKYDMVDADLRAYELLEPAELRVYTTAERAMWPPWKRRTGAFGAVKGIQDAGIEAWMVSAGDAVVQLRKYAWVDGLAEQFPRERFLVASFDKTEKMRDMLAFLMDGEEKMGVGIGDSKSDIKAYHDAGLKAIWTPPATGTSWTDSAHMAEVGADAMTTDMREVPELAKKLLGLA